MTIDEQKDNVIIIQSPRRNGKTRDMMNYALRPLPGSPRIIWWNEPHTNSTTWSYTYLALLEFLYPQPKANKWLKSTPKGIYPIEFICLTDFLRNNSEKDSGLKWVSN